MLKISPVKFSYVNPLKPETKGQTSSVKVQVNELNNLYYSPYNPSFKQNKAVTQADFNKAQKYMNGLQCKDGLSLKDVNLEKAEGLQFGLKTFEGLSMKEITFMLKDLEVLAVKRGCKHHCGHCIFNSEKTLKNTDNQMGTIDFDDFSNLLKDIKELNNRMGFNVITKDNSEDMILFFDSDSLDITLKDKNNKKYDYAMLNRMQYQATGKPGTFDTQGWDIDNESVQKRAERIVNYYKKDENFKEIHQMNISINPFHKYIQESVKAFEEGDDKLAKDKLSEYVKRQANVLFTFTPISEKTKIIVRVAKTTDKNTTDDMGNYGLELQNQINQMIMQELVVLYFKDLKGAKKCVKSIEDLDKKLKDWSGKINRIYAVTPKGRMTQFYTKRNDVSHRVAKMKNVKKIIKEKGSINGTHLTGQLDINGKFYIFNDPVACPTELQLNFKNKDKKTRDLAFGLEKQYGLTKEFLQTNLKDKV